MKDMLTVVLFGRRSRAPTFYHRTAWRRPRWASLWRRRRRRLQTEQEDDFRGNAAVTVWVCFLFHLVVSCLWCPWVSITSCPGVFSCGRLSPASNHLHRPSVFKPCVSCPVSVHWLGFLRCCWVSCLWRWVCLLVFPVRVSPQGLFHFFMKKVVL